jgi:hypothetical protein
MVVQVRAGKSMRSVAGEHQISLSTVQWWMRRAADLPLGRVDWRTHPPIATKIRRTDATIEDLVVSLRRELKETSDLGEYGARAIHRELVVRAHEAAPPSVRTVGRILERRGALDGKRRIRRTPPPPGWYLPEVSQRRAELDSFDIIEGFTLEGGVRLETLNVVSLHGGLPGSWPQTLVTAKIAVEALVEHWREFGLPAYAQFDNDTIFQGSHHGQDSLGRVVRTCLQLGVTPVFAPPQESGFQAAIENFNGRWHAKVWLRFHHDSLVDLQQCSARYVAAYRRRAAARIEAAPPRRPFPLRWRQDLQAHPRGLVIFIRRTSERGAVSLLGRSFDVDRLWPHRLVRCDLDLDAHAVRFHALRRREPSHHARLCTAPYTFPKRAFHE